MKRVKPRAKLTTVQLQSARQHSSSSTALLSSVRNIHDNLFCVDCSHILSLSGCVHSFLAVISAQSTSDIDEKQRWKFIFTLSHDDSSRYVLFSASKSFESSWMFSWTGEFAQETSLKEFCSYIYIFTFYFISTRSHSTGQSVTWHTITR